MGKKDELSESMNTLIGMTKGSSKRLKESTEKDLKKASDAERRAKEIMSCDELISSGMPKKLAAAHALKTAGDAYNHMTNYRKAGEMYGRAGELAEEDKEYFFALQSYADAQHAFAKARNEQKANEFRGRASKLEGSVSRTYRLTSVIAIAGVLGGLFFLSTNITGNAIANMTNSTSSILSAVLLVIGLVAGAFALKSK